MSNLVKHLTIPIKTSTANTWFRVCSLSTPHIISQSLECVFSWLVLLSFSKCIYNFFVNYPHCLLLAKYPLIDNHRENWHVSNNSLNSAIWHSAMWLSGIKIVFSAELSCLQNSVFFCFDRNLHSAWSRAKHINTTFFKW